MDALLAHPLTAAAWAVAGLLAGVLLAVLLRRGRGAAERSVLLERLAGRDERLADLRGELETAHGRLRELEEERSALAARLAESEARLAAEQRAAAEKLELLEDARERLGETFRALSARALERNTTSFLELAGNQLEAHQRRAAGDLESRQKAIGALIAPVREALDKVEGKITEVEKNRSQAYGSLTRYLEGLAESQSRLTSETANLARALRAPTVRGRWGEIQLQRVVEMAGLVEHCDFVRQETVDGDGDRGSRRPDLVVRLPAERRIVVDAKAPLAHYLEAAEAADEGERQRLLAEHARAVRRHLTRLGSKAYWDRLDGTPEFVVLFLPGETFFSAALEQDPALIEFGVDQRVIPATPTTLIALLKAVAYGWRHERLADNAREISELGRELHGRLRVFAGHFEALRKGLERAVDAYNRAVGSFETRVLVGARRFEELGASSGDDLEGAAGVERRARVLAGGVGGGSGGGEEEPDTADGAAAPRDDAETP